MITRISIAILFLAVSAAGQSSSSTVGQAQSKEAKASPALMRAFGNFGGWWNSLSDEAKDNFVDGYLTAMDRVRSITDAFGKEARGRMAPGPNFNEQFDHAMLLSLLATEFNYDKAKGSLRNGLNDFYSDPLNARILVSLALGHVRDQFEGRKTAGQLLDELNDWRKIFNRNSP